jgi:hypothetical protein
LRRLDDEYLNVTDPWIRTHIDDADDRTRFQIPDSRFQVQNPDPGSPR